MAQIPTRTGLALCVLLSLAPLFLIGCGDDLDTVRQLQDNQQFEASLELLRPLVAAKPNDSEILYRYGTALANTGQPSLALWSLEKASKDPDWAHAAGLVLALTAAKGKHWVAAIEAADRVLAIDPENTAALLLRAESRLEDKRNAEGALDDFNRVLELDPGNLDAEVSKAATLLHLERFEEAAEIIRSLEEHSGELESRQAGRFCVVAAAYSYEDGDIDGAEEQLLGCVERYPEDAFVLTRTLSFYDTRGRREVTNQLLREAMGRNPTEPFFRVALAIRSRATGDAQEAERLLREGTTHSDPRVVTECWRALTDHFRALGNYAAAVEAADEVLRRIQTPSPEELFAFADLLGMAGENARALAVAERINSEVLQNLVIARVRLNERKPEAALEHLDSALRLWPDMPQARYYAGVTAERLGRIERALAEYRQAIRIGAQHTDAGLRLARLYVGLGDLQSAQIAIQHHVGAHTTDLEATRVGLQIASRLGNDALRDELLELYERAPLRLPRVYEMLAQVQSDKDGPAAAVALLTAGERFDFGAPRDLPALRAWVQHALVAGESGSARAALAAALAANPQEAGLYEIHATVLDHDGGRAAEVEQALHKAIELDAEHARALRRLARIAETRGESDSALSLFERAQRAESQDPSLQPESWREVANLLVASGRQEEAEARLGDFLWQHPHDGRAALMLAQLRESRSAPERQETHELARRAFHLGAGDEARTLMERLESSSESEEG
jgi:tetratricopeptide (TPR) repeat protein